MSQLALQGVVFDVDGVLFDTERLTNQTWLAVGKELGWPQIGEYYLEFVGQNRTDIHQKMLDLFGPEFPKEEFMKTCSAYSQARMEREGVPMKPGVREILDFLKARNIPIALATSTGRERTLRRMELTGLGPYFSAIITGDQVVHSKPAPETYQLDSLRLSGGNEGHYGSRHDPPYSGTGCAALSPLHQFAGGTGLFDSAAGFLILKTEDRPHRVGPLFFNVLFLIPPASPDTPPAHPGT